MRLIDADRLANLMQNDLEDFETMISEHGKGVAHGTRIALGLVKEQPTISPESLQPQWIPVTERMPQEHQIVETEPSADVAPVVHGKWKPVRYTTYCSCGKSYETYHYLCTACNHVAYAQPYGLKYCPNCGAKMDKEANEND